MIPTLFWPNYVQIGGGGGGGGGTLRGGSLTGVSGLFLDRGKAIGGPRENGATNGAGELRPLRRPS